MKRAGFSLMEMLVVIAIIAFFAMIAFPRFSAMIARAKRTEAQMHLRALWSQQMVYHAMHGNYTDKLTGPDGLGWQVHGAPVYTYGFPGTPGVHYIVGSAGAEGAALSPGGIRKDGFIIVAAADIDGDGVCDVVTINQDGVIQIVTDDTL